MGRPEVGPLGQVGLAEDDRAGRAQLADQERVLRLARPPGLASPRSPAIRLTRDVVLDQDRDAGERSWRGARRPALVGRRWPAAPRSSLDRDDGAETAVQALDPAQVEPGQLSGGQLALIPSPLVSAGDRDRVGVDACTYRWFRFGIALPTWWKTRRAGRFAASGGRRWLRRGRPVRRPRR